MSTIENNTNIITYYLDELLYNLDAMYNRTGVQSDYHEHKTPVNTDTIKYLINGASINPDECYTMEIDHDKYGTHTITLKNRELAFSDPLKETVLYARMIATIDNKHDYFIEVPMTIIDGDWTILTDYDYDPLITITPLTGYSPAE